MHSLNVSHVDDEEIKAVPNSKLVDTFLSSVPKFGLFIKEDDPQYD
jgi:hypothetical protein